MEMVGTVKSNNFRVRDEAAFRTWFDAYRFGSEIQLIRDDGARSGKTDGQPREATLCFYGSELYPSAYPKLASDEDEEDEPQEVEADFEQFATELRAHLCEGEALHVIACGAEGARYAAYEELAVTASGRAFRSASSDSNANADAHRLVAEQGSAGPRSAP